MNLEEIKTIARKRKTEKEIGVKGGGEDLETVQGRKYFDLVICIAANLFILILYDFD